MCFLHCGIGLGQSGSWLAQSKAELTEHTLALANPDDDAIPLLNPGTECFSIPQVPAQTNLPRRVTQDPIHPFPLFFRQASGPPRSFALQQSRQTVSFKTTHPILHRPWRITQEMGHFWTGHTLGDQKHSMETMIVARFFRAADLILQSENDGGRVGNGKWFHSSMKPHSYRYAQLLMSSCLERTVIDPQTGFMQPMAVGQKAADIARFAGLSVKPNTKLLIAPIQGVGRDHPLSVEKLFPVLAVYRAKSVAEALRVCVDVNHAGGIGHTAVIFSRNEEVIRKFGDVINAGRVIVNSPGSIGALGAVYNDLVPTFSFGCGTGGGNSTTDNVNIFHYLNIKRLARRTQTHMWFRVPNQIYFNMNAVENLRQFPSQSTIIVTSPLLEQMGHVDLVRRRICPKTHVHVQVIPDAEPEVRIIAQGVESLNFYKADQIIALGGGSVIDAAKIMKLKYESPEADLEYLAAPFLDLRKRVVEYPTEKVNRARLIAISTTSGTGSEVTPFAVLTDKASGRKVTLADYSLTPDVAIVDPQFVMSMPKALTADTGIDCLTHALEAGVSNYASPYTDSSAMQAIRLVFKYLPIAYEHPQDEEARCMMHNAACIAAMAFSNASVGVNHALAHAFGARFGVPHGRANALMLPHVMAYNAAVPTKFMPSPYTQGYVAHKKYATVADLLGLGGHTVDEKVKNLIQATEQLLDQLGFPRSIAELGISREEFERAVPELASIAFDDPSWRSNPRMPLMSELVELFWKAYEGRGVAKAAGMSQQQTL